ncbi:MAG TPA: hypothetical protein VMH02_01970 [Verrucomicrobiae bacterium]|nr:hypothetical protein [Verrucomicrobiae bacterium]
MEGPSRRGLSGIVMSCALLGATAAVAIAAKTPVQQGVFALLGGTQQATAQMRVAPASSPAGLAVRIRQFQMDGTTPIVNYTVDMERTMHMIVVRDDFKTFAHLHPDIDATTGTFHQTLTGLDPTHRYYLYADTVPQGMAQQVFRFTLQGQNIAAVPPAETLAASATTAAAGGPYTVQLSTTTLNAAQPSRLLIAIKEHKKPAGDLAPYLGMPAHLVLIGATSLQYIHIHPYLRGSSMTAAMKAAAAGTPQTGPYLAADLPALPPGSYKLWVQFRGAALKLYVANFTLDAQ